MRNIKPWVLKAPFFIVYFMWTVGSVLGAYFLRSVDLRSAAIATTALLVSPIALYAAVRAYAVAYHYERKQEEDENEKA